MVVRQRKVTFRVSDDELRALRRKVEKTGYSQEAYLRSLIRGMVPPDKPPPDYHAMMHELRKIGTNLNQIAYKANRLREIDSEKYEEAAQRLADAIVEISQAVKLPRKL